MERIGQKTASRSSPRYAKNMRRVLKKGVWVLVVLVGLYLVFLEVGMLFSESHVFKGSNIAVFAVFVAVGLFLVFLGVSKAVKT
jgi:hypothetical protein